MPLVQGQNLVVETGASKEQEQLQELLIKCSLSWLLIKISLYGMRIYIQVSVPDYVSVFK